MTTVELIATVFGLACVWLYTRQNIWSWPTGLVQVVLFAWVFFHAKLYADFGLHLVYVVLQLYGWYHWRRGGSAQGDQLPVTRLSPALGGGLFAAAAIGTVGLGLALRRYTAATLPYWDAAIAMLSLAAQYLIARKVLENWLIWIVVDVLAIGVFFAKGLYLTTGLYAVFLVMAAMGWVAWRTSYRGQVSAAGMLRAAAGSSSESSSRRTADISSSSTSPATTASG